MCFRRAGFILVAAIIPMVGAIFLHAQEIEKNAAHAREIFQQVRKTIGGDAALDAIRSLSASGTWRSVLQDEGMTGDIKIDLLLPDKYMRTTTLSGKDMPRVTRVETVDGEEAWTDAKTAQDTTVLSAGSLGGRSMGGSRGRGGRGGGGDPVPDIVAEPENPENQKQIRADFSSLLTVLLLPVTVSSSIVMDSAAAWTANEAMYDTLKIQGANDLELRLMIDKKTHRPVMISYHGFMPGVSASHPIHIHAGQEPPTLQESGTVEIDINVSDYRAVSEKGIGTIWLPYRIMKIADDHTVEDITIKTFKLHPDLKANQFERKRSPLGNFPNLR